MIYLTTTVIKPGHPIPVSASLLAPTWKQYVTYQSDYDKFVFKYQRNADRTSTYPKVRTAFSKYVYTYTINDKQKEIVLSIFQMKESNTGTFRIDLKGA
jgi:hypothetical protein